MTHSISHRASAPGKIILCGEHAVVYGRPAVALPLGDLRAYATVAAASGSGIISFDAPDLGRTWLLDGKPNDPLSLLTIEVLAALGIHKPRSLHITITSSIPIASGMGSGAAVATALVRALAACVGNAVSDEQVSALVYENERRLHGTPSGIDNTVVAFEQPTWFVRGSMPNDQRSIADIPLAATAHASPPTIEFIPIASPFTLLIADTGIRSATKLPVGEVRRRWQAEPARYEALFDQVAELAHAARAALAAGDLAALGPLLDLNHQLLQAIGVSSLDLDRMVLAAKAAGALGAKLSGAGWGGVMLALIRPETQQQVAEALQAAGAARVLATVVTATQPDKL